MPDSYIHNNQLGKDVWVIGDLVKAWSNAVKEILGNKIFGKGMSQDYIEWKMSGGAQAAFVSEDVDYIQRSIDEATTTWAQRHKTLSPTKFFSEVLKDFQKVSETTEEITRLTTYKMAKARLAKGGEASLTDMQLAALAAREATVDFAKAGRSTRVINKYIPFFNAAVQSLNLWIEAFKKWNWGKGDAKPLVGKFFRATAQGVLMAGLQAAFAFGGGDDDKKAYLQAPEWEKETYWIFPNIKLPSGNALKIPKGFDFGMRLMANATDEVTSAYFADKPIEAKRFLKTFTSALPSITATIITPVVEVNYGKGGQSFFKDAPIVPRREQNLDAWAQYDATTSGVAKWVGKNTVPLAQFFGAQTGWSPRKIDYLINSYLGFMGRFATNPSTDPDKFPMVRRFIFEPYKNPKTVKEYYEAYEEQTRHYNTYKNTKEKPKGYDPALFKRLKAANEILQRINNQERKIQNSENLSYSERRAKLMALEERRVALCEKALRRAQ